MFKSYFYYNRGSIKKRYLEIGNKGDKMELQKYSKHLIQNIKNT